MKDTQYIPNHKTHIIPARRTPRVNAPSRIAYIISINRNYVWLTVLQYYTHNTLPIIKHPEWLLIYEISPHALFGCHIQVKWKRNGKNHVVPTNIVVKYKTALCIYTTS